MGNVLDHIIKREIITSEEVSPATVTSGDFNSSAIFEVDRAEGGFAMTAELSGGDGSVNMTFWIQGSTDGVNFADLTDNAGILFQDDEGSVTWDVLDTNVLYVRVRVAHVAGTINIDKIRFTAQRRH